MVENPVGLDSGFHSPGGWCVPGSWYKRNPRASGCLAGSARAGVRSRRFSGEVDALCVRPAQDAVRQTVTTQQAQGSSPFSVLIRMNNSAFQAWQLPGPCLEFISLGLQIWGLTWEGQRSVLERRMKWQIILVFQGWNHNITG